MVVTKQDLHQLIDEIPEQEHQAAAKYLQRLRDFANDPVYQAFRTLQSTTSQYLRRSAALSTRRRPKSRAARS